MFPRVILGRRTTNFAKHFTLSRLNDAFRRTLTTLMTPTRRIAANLVPFLSVLAVSMAADKEEGWNPDTTFPALPPAEAIKTIEIP